MPPEWMWPLPWEIDAALERVVEARKAKRGNNDSSEPPPPAPGTGNTLYEQRMAEINAAQPARGAGQPAVHLPDVIPARS